MLARTSPPDPEHRHAGFSQFLVPCDADGVRIEPIVLMNGEHHFNEVIFDEVFVPDADVLGEVGNGWHQVTAELSFERSGPERMLSTASADRRRDPGAECGADRPTTAPPPTSVDLLARLISLRQLSVWVARTLSDDKDAANQAALVKDLGTRFEQESVEVIADLLDQSPTTPELAALAGHRMAAQAACSRCAAAPTRYCAASSHAEWGCGDGTFGRGLRLPAPQTTTAPNCASWSTTSDGGPSTPSSVSCRVPEQFDADLWRNLEDTGLTRLTSTPDLDAGPQELAIVLYGVARACGRGPAGRNRRAGRLAGPAGRHRCP